MDGVNLKPGWLNDGRSRVNTCGAQQYGDLYRQGELLSSFGGADAPLGQWGGFGRPPLSITTAPRPAVPARTPASSSRAAAPVVSRSAQSGQARPLPVPVVPSTAVPSGASTWGAQPRAVSQPLAQPTTVKPTPLAGLQFGKVAPPPTAVRSSGSAASHSKAPATPSKPVPPSPSRAVMTSATTVKTQAALSSSAPTGGESKAEDEASKQSRKEKLEQRRRFLEELASGKGDAETTEPAPEADRAPGGSGEWRESEVQRLEGEQGSVEVAQVERQFSKEEWDAKWRAMYGSFVDVALSSELGEEGEGSAEAEGESLLTEEELAAFKAAHGCIPRRPKQLLLSSRWHGCGCSTPSRGRVEDEALTSDDDSDDE